MRTLLSVQYLRAVAALMVVLFHAFQWTWTEFPIGQAGVDLFFVISGFVMWVIAERGPVSPLTFLRRRAARIVPAYWLLTLVAAGLALAWPLMFKEVRVEGGHLVKSLLFLPHRDPAGAPFPLLAQGWTLVYEVFFYLVFALALPFGRAGRLAVVTAILAFTASLGFLHPPFYIFGANPLVLEFLAGVWLGKLWSERALASRGTGWMLIGMGVVVLAALQVSGFNDPFWRVLLWGGPALLIVTGALSIETEGGVAAIGWLRSLGDASYSIYLVHPLLNAAIPRLVGITRPELFIPVVIAASIGVGILCRQLVEKPALRLLAGRRAVQASSDDPAAMAGAI